MAIGGRYLETDNALVYASELDRDLARSYGLHQEFVLPHSPEQNGVAESFMGTLKLECVWQRRFETYEEAKATITTWVKHYNETRPHSRRSRELRPCAERLKPSIRPWGKERDT